jgi:FAD/FMN-containing dehydrogenase/Fe-S oxidoreductase
MTPERERIQSDLRGLLDGEVRCDDVFLQMYATDGSIFEIRPLAVARPQHTRDVVACLQYASENHLPVHPRGAGSGLAGESLGSGLVLDFSHSMRRILDVGETTVRVQPGVVASQLNRQLASLGRRFAPDSDSSQVSTIGGMISRDVIGCRGLLYGPTHRHVERLQAVLADGSMLDVSVTGENTDRTVSANGSPEVTREVGQLLRRHEPTIANRHGSDAACPFGYHLSGVSTPSGVDFVKLLSGSEGTLGVITEATLRTVALPKHRGMVMFFFDRLETAARAAVELTSQNVTACELMDRRLVSLARELEVQYDVLIPAETEALVLAEVYGDSAADAADRLNGLVEDIGRRRQLAFDSRVAVDAGDVEIFWRLISRTVPALYRLTGKTRPIPFLDDVMVPARRLPDFIRRVQNLLKRHQVTATLFSHAAQGQLRVTPFFDLSRPDHRTTVLKLAGDLYHEVIDVGGGIGGEHGLGLSRGWTIRGIAGSLYDVFCDVKRAFDPHNVLNPGKIVWASSPEALFINRLRRDLSAASKRFLAPAAEPDDEKPTDELIRLQTSWQEGEIDRQLEDCNGCGHCRTQSPIARMCPIFRILPAEESSPRAKANLMRAVMTGRLDSSELLGESLKDIADLCVNCHQCRFECPAKVDIPRLMVECKSQYVANNGLRLADHFLARLDLVAGWASLVRPLSNWAIGNPQMRWMLERFFGIAQGRRLPRLARRTFLRKAARRRLTKSTRRSDHKVLFFVDIYANWFDTELADALVAVLEHNGIAVYVPPRQRQSGMSLVTAGAVELARELAAHNVALLADAVRQGYQIVATEPAAALCIQREYPRLVGEGDAQLVAENTSEACAFLWKMHQAGQLSLDLNPLPFSLGYHQPCHVRAMQIGTPSVNLMRLVPELSVRQVADGCSGMAGVYGLKKKNFRSSVRAGWRLISGLRDESLLAGVTECSSCKLQMEQGTEKPTTHPVKILARAYGLSPRMKDLPIDAATE